MLDLRLYEGGARIDRLDSDPDYFGGKPTSKKTRDELGGDPARWSALGDRERLREAWRGRDLFAEGMLARTCEIVGCDVRRASTGYRYTVHDRDAIPAGTITLRFRARTRPTWEAASTEEPELVTDSFVEGEIPLGVGDELRVSLGARSAGRASTGLGIRCWGSALERGLVVVERFEVVVGSVKEGARHRSFAPEVSRSEGGAPLLVVDLAAEEIPAGSADPFAGFTPGMDFMRAIEASQRSKVHVNVVGRVVAAGKGELGIGLVPLERPEAAAGTIARLGIDPPFERPLRAPDLGHGHASHLLRPLAGDQYLLAMAAIDAPRAELARHVREVIELVRGVLADTDAVSTATFFTDPATRPRTGAGKVKTMLRGKRLDALVSAVATEQMVTVDAGPVALAAGTSVLPDRDEERTPWLAISVRMDTPGRDAWALREPLSAVLDGIMRGRGVQAVIARTGWAASGPVDSTPYEIACSIAHGVGTLRAWTARWVRVPGNDRLWLSSALAARVDREALGAIADLEPIGDALRITLRDRAAWSALEHAIADLLPTADASHRALMDWHQRRAER